MMRLKNAFDSILVCLFAYEANEIYKIKLLNKQIQSQYMSEVPMDSKLQINTHSIQDGMDIY